MDTLLVATAISLTASQAFGWGEDGHKAIWEVAQQRLTPAAKTRVDSILANDKLELTSVWLDLVRDVGKGKGGPLETDAEAIALNQQFKYNATWHYVNLPLAAKSYDSAPEFHGIDNIVTQIRVANEVLAGKSNAMAQKAALRVLVHLVGDIHQPLHCSAGFFDISDKSQPLLCTEPSKCKILADQKCGDQGGNLLFFGPEKYDQLHAYWDSDAVYRVAPVGGLAHHLQKLAPTVKATTEGQPDTWPAQWASESVQIAAKAYEGLKFGRCSPPVDGKGLGPIGRIEVTLPPRYGDYSKKVAADQLTKAAMRLAFLLNGLFK